MQRLVGANDVLFLATVRPRAAGDGVIGLEELGAALKAQPEAVGTQPLRDARVADAALERCDGLQVLRPPGDARRARPRARRVRACENTAAMASTGAAPRRAEGSAEEEHRGGGGGPGRGGRHVGASVVERRGGGGEALAGAPRGQAAAGSRTQTGAHARAGAFAAAPPPVPGAQRGLFSASPAASSRPQRIPGQARSGRLRGGGERAL